MTTATDHLTRFRGDLLRPGAPGYDAARRVWNGMHDRRPSLVARCVDTEDVSAVLRHAVATGTTVTVRGGGHNVAGTALADGAVLVDLSAMNAVEVDADARLATAQGGCLLRDVDAATTPFGLACPSGVVSHTGLGGLALGGGYGWLARRWGLTCDHLVAAEVVLADGSVVEAGADSHPELFWALRGGGGGFGVVTRFTLRLRRVGPIYHHVGVYPLGPLTDYQEFAQRQVDDLHTVGALKRAGDQDWIPAGLRGEPAAFLTAVWLGDPEQGPGRTATLFDSAAGSHARVLSYAELQALGDHSEPHGNRYYTKSAYLTELPDTVLDAARDMPSELSCVDFEYLRGAIDAGQDTAFPRRDAPYICTVSAQWTDPAGDDANVRWARRAVERLRAKRYGGAYVNYLQDEDPGTLAEVYGAATTARLAEVKHRYDPGTVISGTVISGNRTTTPATDERTTP